MISGTGKKTLAVCFGQFGPYHHARVAALQRAAAERGLRVVPVQTAAATTTYEWKTSDHGTTGPQDDWTAGGQNSAFCALHSNLAHGLRTLCDGVEEAASPVEVFLKARKLFREEKVDVAFLPSYSPARFFSLFAAAKLLGIRTVMMNESHAGTEQATGWKRWIKRQIVKQFNAALVGGEPHKRHFASLGIPADKIFTGYDAVDNDFFASRADEIRAVAKKSWQFSVFSVQQEEKADEVRSMPSGSENPRVGEEHGARRVEQERPEAEHLSTLNPKPSTEQSLRSAYGLPQRYFLSLGRMVEKKNLSTLVEAYARFARASGEKRGAGRGEHGVIETTETRHTPASLVFVGSGELEGALREQARSLGLRVVDRTKKKGHGLTRINTDKSERLAADRTEGNADCRMTSTAGGLSPETTDGEDAAATKTRDSLPATSHEENCGTVFFYGFRQIEENPVFYALAEAFVLPSLKEEWGLVVNEAMACSLPVIVSRTAGCAEDLLLGSESWQCSVGSMQFGENARALNPQRSTLNSLEERSNGFVFDPKSSDALSEALRRIADPLNPQLSTLNAAAMGRRSREIVATFSCENFARQALRAVEAAGA